MLDFGGILIFSENPSELVAFYKKVLESEPDWSGGEFKGFKVGSSEIAIGPHDKVKGKNSNPERIMFNLVTSDVKAEFERIKGLDVTVVQEPYQPAEEPDMWLATFEDPDGNYFQLMTPLKG